MLRPSTVKWLRRALREGSHSRAGLARELCRRDEWRNARGKLCAASARKGLPRLAAELGLELPAPRRRAGGCRRRSPQQAQAAHAKVDLQCRLDVDRVRLCLARSAVERRHWAGLLAAEHPLGRGSAPGGRLVYGVRANGLDVGVISFVAAPLRLPPRDKHLGWDARTRRRNIARLVLNDRFLVRPGVRVPNLASHVLGLALRRLADDWEQRYGVRPVAVETLVERPRRASCYRAANFDKLGQTGGRVWGEAPPKRKRSGKPEPGPHPKQVWVRGLLPRGAWEQVLRERARPVLGSFPELDLGAAEHWSTREFERSDLPDRRLRERLKALGQAWEHNPGRCVPAICPGSAEQQAAYRFLHNPRVGVDDILQPHREAMAERCRQLPGPLLLVQDTTTLNYTGLKDCTAGLGPLKKRSESSRGLHVHAAVAFTEGRRPLGVSGLEVWARPLQEPPDEGEKESRRWFRGLRQGLELAQARGGRPVLVVGDRESDIYDLFKLQSEHEEQGLELLVRVNLGRQRKVRVRCTQLRTEMLRPLREQPDFLRRVRFGRSFRVLSQGGKRARRGKRIETEVRIGAVEVQPPEARRQRGERGVEAWLVHVLQTNPEPGEDPLEWLLLSTLGGPSEPWARRIVRWYEARWGIEEFFRVLKSGARIEDRRLRTAQALQKCLAFDAITAWQVFSLARYAREAPDTPAAEVLTRDEMRVIWAQVKAKRLLPPQERGRPPPGDIRTWVVLLARTTGFRPSKRRPLPGNEVLWRACEDLWRAVDTLQALRETGAEF